MKKAICESCIGCEQSYFNIHKYKGNCERYKKKKFLRIIKIIDWIKARIFIWIWDHSRFLFEIAMDDDDLWDYFYDNMDREYVKDILY